MDYLSHTDEERRAMLERIGVKSIEELFADLPDELVDPPIELPPPLTEPEILARLERVKAPEHVCFLGAGAYDCHVPAIAAYLTGRTEFQTAYTPYQPEISQGTLTTIYEFQSAITRLTGLPVANASVYDGASAAGEAAALAVRSAKKEGRVLVSRTLHPFYRRVVATYLEDLACADGTCARHEEIGLTAGGLTDLADLKTKLADDVAAVIIGSPNFFGLVEDWTAAFSLVHEKSKALAVAVSSPLPLAVLKTPAECGADVAVGDAQPVAATLSGGGPYVGFIAATKRLARKMPGRIVGRTLDADGKVCYALTLQTREQHIRREKATSNICTNNALVALAANITLNALGPAGITELAELNLQKAHYAARELTKLEGVELLFPDGYFFNEFALKLPPGAAERAFAGLPGRGFVPGLPLGRLYPECADGLLVAVTDRRTRAEIDSLVAALGEVL
jgi:glycine dehydrogenase subunit 1